MIVYIYKQLRAALLGSARWTDGYCHYSARPNQRSIAC
jgi:hypothetical protein